MAGLAAGRLGSSSDAHLSVVSWAQCKGGLLTDVEHLIIQMQTQHTADQSFFISQCFMYPTMTRREGGRVRGGERCLQSL